MQIKLDVLFIQIINILLLLWIFRKLIGKTLSDEILARRKLMQKLKNADAEYEKTLAEAAQKAQLLIDEGLQKKQAIVADGTIFAEQKKQMIIDAAHEEAEKIKQKAKSETEKIESDLKSHREEGVKQTATLVVAKLLNTDQKIQSAYLDECIKEVQKV